MPYRVEISPNNRAGCQVKACKDAGDKITKGQLRQGTWTTIPKAGGEGVNESWKWRHWGCVTPKILENMKKESSEDMDLIDGLQDLPEEEQNKVIDAIANGHVDDADWKGDVKKNRPAGFKWDDEDDENAPKKKTTKKRGKKAEDDEDEGQAPPKKRGRKSKKVKDEEDDEDDAPVEPAAKAQPKTKRKSARDTAATAQTDGAIYDAGDATEEKPKKGRGRPKATKVTVDDEEEKPAPAKKARVSKKKAAAEPVVDDDEDDEPEEEAPKIKGRSRGRASKKA